MTETLNHQELANLISLESMSVQSLADFVQCVLNDEHVSQPVSIMVANPRGELRLTFWISKSGKRIQDVRIVVRSEILMDKARLISDFFSVRGKRKSTIIEHFD